MKPYYNLASALYMAKEHGLKFVFERWSGGDYLTIIHWIQVDCNVGRVDDFNHTKFYLSDPSVLEPREGDRDDKYHKFSQGEWLEYDDENWGIINEECEVHFRNGKAFLQPHWEN